MVFVARKLGTIDDGAKIKIVRFGEDITGTQVTNRKAVLGSSPGEDDCGR
jgi:hypothetical protein